MQGAVGSALSMLTAHPPVDYPVACWRFPLGCIPKDTRHRLFETPPAVLGHHPGNSNVNLAELCDLVFCRRWTGGSLAAVGLLPCDWDDWLFSISAPASHRPSSDGGANPACRTALGSDGAAAAAPSRGVSRSGGGGGGESGVPPVAGAHAWQLEADDVDDILQLLRLEGESSSGSGNGGGAAAAVSATGSRVAGGRRQPAWQEAGSSDEEGGFQVTRGSYGGTASRKLAPSSAAAAQPSPEARPRVSFANALPARPPAGQPIRPAPRRGSGPPPGAEQASSREPRDSQLSRRRRSHEDCEPWWSDPPAPPRRGGSISFANELPPRPGGDGGRCGSSADKSQWEEPALPVPRRGGGITSVNALPLQPGGDGGGPGSGADEPRWEPPPPPRRGGGISFASALPPLPRRPRPVGGGGSGAGGTYSDPTQQRDEGRLRFSGELRWRPAGSPGEVLFDCVAAPGSAAASSHGRSEALDLIDGALAAAGADPNLAIVSCCSLGLLSCVSHRRTVM